MSRIRQVRKRDGRVVAFQRAKIADAIFRAARAVGGEDRFLAEELAGVVEAQLRMRGDGPPRIEDIQDVVESVLIETGHARTAKAYILYRERRAAARTARRAAEAGDRPLKGGRGVEEPRAWDKTEIAGDLVARLGLEPVEAQDVARRVEERILASGLPRIPDATVAALVTAELFERGRGGVGAGPTGRVAGLPSESVEQALLGRTTGRRAEDPGAATRALGEQVLAEYVLSEVLPGPAAEAHRVGDLHLYDLGAPLSLTAIALPLGPLLARHLHGETVGRREGARRVSAALAEIARRYGAYGGRVVALEDVNVHLAPFLSHLDEDALAAEMRELLLQPELQAFPQRGGVLDLELGLTSGVPERLAALEVPAPAPPGRRYRDFADTAQEVARALLRESVVLRRQGVKTRLRFTLVLPRGDERDAAERALLRQALRAAAEGGEPRVVFEDERAPARGSRWLRVTEAEVRDPLRFPEGDVTVATAAAVNLVGAALRTEPGHMDRFLAGLDPLVRHALDAAVARRGLLARSGDDPGGTLWSLRRGPVPLVDLEGAWHLFEPVGAARAVALLEPEAPPAARALLVERVLAHMEERLAAGAADRGLTALLVRGLTHEPGARFARLDAARYGVAAGWWAAEDVPDYTAPPPDPGEARREPARTAGWRRDTRFARIRHRVDAERRPPVDELLAAVESAAHDVSVVEYALEPWPRRIVRREP